MITKGHANECIMINERHNAYDELQGIGAYKIWADGSVVKKHIDFVRGKIQDRVQ